MTQSTFAPVENATSEQPAPKVESTKYFVEKWIDSTLEGYRSFKLPQVPGMYTTVYSNGTDNNPQPAYVLALRGNAGVPFVMPDFVHHPGVSRGEGFQGFSHDVFHMLDNNVCENVPYIKRCWSELHNVGTPDKRWRKGRLGNAGVLEGKTLIICAPGPSLSSKMDLIAKLRERDDVAVMAINRATRAVPADYVLWIERWVPEEWRDETAIDLQRGATLLACPQTDFHAVRAWPDKDRIYWGFFNMGRYAADERVNHLELMDAMASTTAATALRAGYEMGAERIILVGMDFSCPAELTVTKLPLNPDAAVQGLEMMKLLAEEVSNGNGKKPRVKELADKATEYNSERERLGWCPAWYPSNFYYDQHFSKTSYVGDPRFSNWRPVASPVGKPVLTTMEFLTYAEQLRTICAIVESGDCPVINGSPEGMLNWNPRALEDIAREMGVVDGDDNAG